MWASANLLAHNMKYKKTTWNINTRDTKYFGDTILLGVGTDPSDEPVNAYTRKLYQQVLSSKYKHSVRDERTKQMLENFGVFEKSIRVVLRCGDSQKNIVNKSQQEKGLCGFYVNRLCTSRKRRL